MTDREAALATMLRRAVHSISSGQPGPWRGNRRLHPGWRPDRRNQGDIHTLLCKLPRDIGCVAAWGPGLIFLSYLTWKTSRDQPSVRTGSEATNRSGPAKALGPLRPKSRTR
jgi:hypothetical protein